MNPVKGRFTVGDVTVEAAVDPEQTFCELEVQLEKGPQQIRTELVDADGKPWSAYYFTIEKN